MISNTLNNIEEQLKELNKIINADYFVRIERKCELVNRRSDDLQKRIDKAIKYIRKNFADIDFMKERYSEKVIYTTRVEIEISDIEKLLNILKGGNNE